MHEGRVKGSQTNSPGDGGGIAIASTQYDIIDPIGGMNFKTSWERPDASVRAAGLGASLLYSPAMISIYHSSYAPTITIGRTRFAFQRNGDNLISHWRGKTR
jgi:hypothetical protein